MKRLFSLFCCFLPLAAGAEQVRHVTAETTRMRPETLTQRFKLKPGALFTTEAYEKAQEDLHKLRVFKTLEFLEEKRKDGVDIHIKADDRSFVFPMVFAVSGKKRAFGASIASGNLFKQGETAYLFAGGGRDGFATHAGLTLGDDTFGIGFKHANYNQSFYKDGWMGAADIFSTADDEHKHKNALLGKVHTRQDDFYVLYARRLSRVWSVFLKPQYEYYNYKGHMLDSGKHSYVSTGISYTDDIRPGLNLGALSGIGLSDKKQALQDLPRVRTGKWAALSYDVGGTWTGSDYEIQKLTLDTAYLIELKTRHVLNLQFKAADAIKAPFSNLVRSSDLLFGLGRYDRERRGKRGASAGVSFSYFLLRNEVGLLCLTPFYELSYLYDGNSYRPHSGLGATLHYKFWRFPLPVGLNYTHNPHDGSKQIGLMVGKAF